MDERGLCLLANNSEIFPEFHQNLLSICRECGLGVREFANAAALLAALSENGSRPTLVIIDLEMLKTVSPAQQLSFRRWAQASAVPVIGLGYYDEETANESRMNRIRHCLLKYQEPSQILSMVRAVTCTARRGGRRHHPRYLVDLRATFKHNGENYQAEVRNLSLGGMFLKTFFTLDAGTEIRLEFRLGDEGEYISCTGKVRHRRGKTLGEVAPEAAGIGVEFSSLPAEALDKLEKFLAQRLPIHLMEDEPS